MFFDFLASLITKGSMLAEFFFALAIGSGDELRALNFDISH